MSRTVLSLTLLGVMLSSVGCANLWHNLQPYRLQRLNRGPAPSLDPEFTYHDHKSQLHQINQLPASDAAKVSGNSATVTTVRAQTPE